MSNELGVNDFPENIKKAFGQDALLKGVYKNTPENRRLGRVGQKYGEHDSSKYSEMGYRLKMIEKYGKGDWEKKMTDDERKIYNKTISNDKRMRR